MVREEVSASEFEEYVGKALKAKYKQRDGWRIRGKERVDYRGMTGICDFVVENKKTGETVVVDAKRKKSLEPSDIHQLLSYKKGLKASEAIFYVLADTVFNTQAIEKNKIEVRRAKFKPKRARAPKVEYGKVKPLPKVDFTRL
jgi:restriction endonuclease Mrr